LQIFTKFVYFKGFDYKILLEFLEFLSYVKVSSSEYLLLAAVVEVAVRAVTLPNLLFFRWCKCLLVLFRLLLH